MSPRSLREFASSPRTPDFRFAARAASALPSIYGPERPFLSGREVAGGEADLRLLEGRFREEGAVRGEDKGCRVDLLFCEGKVPFEPVDPGQVDEGRSSAGAVLDGAVELERLSERHDGLVAAPTRLRCEPVPVPGSRPFPYGRHGRRKRAGTPRTGQPQEHARKQEPSGGKSGPAFPATPGCRPARSPARVRAGCVS